ncbi:MAG: tyrosine-type recombinase/integrase [Bacteroidales bacterium]
MKKKIILKRVFHRDKWRILILFNYDESLAALVKQINGCIFSATYKSWHADDTEELLKQILHIFRDKADIDISALAINPAAGIKVETPKLGVSKTSAINNVEYETPNLGVSKTSAINNVEYETPNLGVSTSTQNLGISTITPCSNDVLPDIRPESQKSEDELISTRRIIEKVVDRERFSPVEFRINEQDGRLAIRFTGHYDGKWINEIESFGRYYYDKVSKEFLLPWSVMTGDSLSDYFSSLGIEVKIIKSEPVGALKTARREMGDRIRSRELGEKAFGGLDLMRRYLDEVRYSERTNESYLALLELFFKYFSEKDPLDISKEEISEFIYDFIVTKGYSKSYQNQIISAIKTFYRISGRSRIDLELFERPRKSRALPKVFSKEEVQRILNATRNTKHKLLLWIIYSCGLRRSEVINIRLTDLDRDRNVLHIKEGKGKVDRIVPVSKKVWEKIDEYVDGFHPLKYLFEGQHGGRYSVESVYRVFKQALQAAGIKKDVGVHSLRHSYATHLHESGLDIRYIQELLGHRSSRTTEIYTHVSRRNLVIIRSPIEDMDVR